jgi:acyl transferase domain-containing protein
MDATFPGAADLDQFWSNVVEGVDAVEEAPSARWDPLYYDPPSAGVDRFYCRRGGFVDGVASFDPAAFGVMPVTMGSAEPDQLLALAVAARALADAGGEAKLERRERTAVIVGRGSYLTPGLARLDQRVRTSEQLVACVRSLVPSVTEEQLVAVKEAFVETLGPDHSEAAIDLVPNLAASRIANRLDLGGPAYTVDAACASALIAVDHGVRELVEGRCDLVLAGAVHLCHDVTIWSVFTQLGALSRSGEIRPFDRRADGLLIGEGAGMVVLERLADAERSGSRIYAVIRGTGLSSDGRSASLMKPDVDGQSLSIKRAWDLAQRPPGAIGLLEAHGTATPTGDMTELETVRRSFGQRQSGRPTAVIGSVKSMIGHAMPAASAAGLVKATLAVYHGVRPPTLHCEEPQPLLESTIFEPLSATEPWPRTDGPRLAGVNAFGFGGINAHVVLEEHGTSVASRPGTSRKRGQAARTQRHASKNTSPDQLVLLSSASRDQLLEQIDRIENNAASSRVGPTPAPQ